MFSTKSHIQQGFVRKTLSPICGQLLWEMLWRRLGKFPMEQEGKSETEVLCKRRDFQVEGCETFLSAMFQSTDTDGCLNIEPVGGLLTES